MQASRNEPTPCPYCGYELDAQTSATDDALPSPGDYTVCLGCANVLVFDHEINPRKPNVFEAGQALEDPVVQLARLRASEAIKDREQIKH